MDEQALESAFKAGLRLSWDWLQAHPGFQLRVLREELRVSQRCLAEESGVDQVLISRFERGADVRLSTMKRLFEALGCFAGLALVTICEESADLLAEAMQRRQARREAGLESGWYRPRLK